MSSSLLKIGQVHAALRGEFPDLELSKIRYYENQGLVTPQRSKKGYRLYAERDVACLREAIRLADAEGIPLRIIRRRLIEQGLLDDVASAKVVTKSAARTAAAPSVSMTVPSEVRPAAAPRLSVVPTQMATPVTSHDTPVATSAPLVNVPLDAVPDTMGLEEFLDRAGIDATTLATLMAHGIVTPGVRGREQFLRSSDLSVAMTGAVLLRNGADVRLLASLRRIVEREIGIVQDLTAALRSAGRDERETTMVVQATQREVAALREAYLQRELGEFFGR